MNGERKLRVLLVTFNMNRKQQNIVFEDLLPNAQTYDVIVVGA